MYRSIIVPAAAALLLGGCVSAGYTYRSNGHGGDYYYGRPSVEYREVGPSPYGPYGYYGYGYYGPYRYYYPGYGYGYRYSVHPYGYPYYYGHPYYGHPSYPRHHHVRPRVDTTPDRPRSPWRDLDDLRRRQQTPPPATTIAPPPPPPAPVVSPSNGRSGSGTSDRIRRARERAESRDRVQ